MKRPTPTAPPQTRQKRDAHVDRKRDTGSEADTREKRKIHHSSHGDNGMARLSRHESSLINAAARTLSLIHLLQASGLVARDPERRRQ